jgi:3-methylcrotonyl-CoA carboxylase alpha subunit
MPSTLTLDGDTSTLDILGRRPQLQVRVGDAVYTVEELPASDEGASTLLINGQPYTVWRTREGDRIHLKLDERTFSVGYQEAVVAAAQGGNAGNEVRAEMPGMVVDVMATAQAEVAAGDPLMVIESMKMQITIAAPRAGVIETLHVERNSSFQKGALLVSLHALAE